MTAAYYAAIGLFALACIAVLAHADLLAAGEHSDLPTPI